MKELTTNSLDPFDFTLWDCIADSARKKRKSKCNWKPFINEYKHFYNSSYDCFDGYAIFPGSQHRRELFN
jgi:hypothetical protein